MARQIAENPTLYIDSNEDAHHQWGAKARGAGFEPKVKALKVDFQFVVMNKLWSIERKAVPSDLEASFKDGRLAAQTLNMTVNEGEGAILLLEGNPMEVGLQSFPFSAVMNAMFEIQAAGVFIEFAKPPDTVYRLKDIYDFLNKPDHSFLRRPKLPMPSQFKYTSREMYQRVRTLMSFYGVGEPASVAALRRHTLWEILQRPELLREATGTVQNATIRKVYEHLGRDVPDYLQKKGKSGKKGRGSRGVAEVDREEVEVAQELALG